MSDLSRLHPTPEELVDYAEGKLADVEAFESHLDVCPECAKSVLACRSLQDRQRLNLIPRLTSQERVMRKDGLRRLLTSSESSKSVANSGFLASLAGLGGAFGLSGVAHGPKPILADQEKPTESSSGENASQNHISENTSPADVTDHDDHASVSGETSTGQTDDVAEMLAKLESILDQNPRAELEGTESGTLDEHGEITTSVGDDAHQLDDTWSNGESMPVELPDESNNMFDDPDDLSSTDDELNDLDT